MAFTYYSPYTVQTSQVPSTQTNFPMLISITDNRLKTVGNGGRVQSANGYDIWLYSDSGRTTRIPCERETYDGTAGTYIAWVLVASLADSSVVYLAYGDSGISTDPNTDGTYGATSVWDSNYKGVYHLPNGSSLTANDSTSNAKNATTTTASAVAGKVDGGASFNGSGDYIRAPLNTASLTFTMEAWLYPDNSTNTRGFLFFNGSDDDGYGIAAGATDSGATGNWVFLAQAVAWKDTGTAFTPDVWSHIVLTRDHGTSTWKFYLNGSQVYTSSTSVPVAPTVDTTIGAEEIAGGITPGRVDEARNSDVVRSANYVLTAYRNQSAPGTFAVLGTEVPISTGVVKTINGTAIASVKTIDGTAVASVKTIDGSAYQ